MESSRCTVTRCSSRYAARWLAGRAAWAGVIGPGAMGCLFGGLLALAGHEVWMLCRRPDQAELLERQGLIVERDGVERRAAVRATADPRRAAPLDFALVLVKSYATAAAAP